MSGRVLIVDDEKNMCELIETDMRLRGFSTSWTTSPAEALRRLQSEDYDVVLTDLKMPKISGTELCERVVGNRPDIPVVVMTAFGSLEAAVAAIRVGAYDFVTKPIELDMLALTLQRAVDHRLLQDKVKILTEAVERTDRFDEMLGKSPAMQGLFGQLPQIAESEASVLISGESGTGKELVAKSIHRLSPRKDGPFVAINCAALPDALLESELFGHIKGAFTDARTDRKGLFQQATGGTLFLDEIGEMQLTVQPKLLRALEENRVRPIGSDQEQAFDVRLITATNRDLESAVEEERFREDLFYRVNVIPVELPPLRARGTDVLLIASHLVKTFAARANKQIVGISDAAAERLLEYSWPGNVRELRNVIERAVALTKLDKIGLDDLPEKIRDFTRAQVFIGGDDPTELVPLEEIERRYILHVMEAVDQHKTLAARLLGLDRKTLYRKLQQYGAN